MGTGDAEEAHAPSTPTRGKRKADEVAAEPVSSQNGTQDAPWEITTPERPKATESTNKQQQTQQQPKVKKAKQAAEPVQIRNGKLILKQKAKSFLDEISVLLGLTELKRFCQTQKEPISQLPDEHLGVIAKFAQENDKASAELSKFIKQRVMGSQDGQAEIDVLPLDTIESALSRIAQRVNYGLDASDVASSSTSASDSDDLPAGLQLWRWEVTDSSLLQGERLSEILARREERIAARARAVEIFQALSVVGREALLSSKKKTSAKASKVKALEAAGQTDEAMSDVKDELADAAGSSTATIVQDGETSAAGADRMTLDVADNKSPPASAKKRRSVSIPRDSRSPERGLVDLAKASKKKVEELSPEEQAEKERKEAEREERRKQKEAKEAKKQKQLEQTKKAASMMSGFFGRAASPSKEMKASATQVSPVTLVVSDFERTFVPIVYKNVAPVNRLATDASPASIDEALTSSRSLSKEELLALTVCKTMPRKRSTTGPRTRLSVRDTMRMVAESDLMTTAAQAEAHDALETLKDRRSRKAVPVKLLQFATDMRPAYFGTWTRPSNLISGRRPLRQDPVALDYNYDSDAEWQDGGDGEDDAKGEEVGDDNDDLEDAMSGSEDESEMADWLVDDLEEDEEGGDIDDAMSDIIEVDPLGNPLSPVLGRSLANGKLSSAKKNSDVASTGTPQFKAAGPPTGNAPKRTLPLPFAGAKKKKKKVKTAKKFTSKLTPLTIGPHWSTALGEEAHPAFAEYQMEFLNDAYVGLDPFTFISKDLSAVAPPAEPVAPVAAPAIPKPHGSPMRGTKFGSGLKGPSHSANTSPQKNSLHAFLNGGAVADGADAPLSAVGSATASTSSTPIAAPATGSGGKSGPLVPDEHLAAVLQAVEGSTDTKMFLLEKLAAQYKEVRSVTKVAISNTLGLAAEKAGAKRGGTWRVKDEWRARAGLA
ncbi:hypothetical protein BCV69DRAFT_282071 [Microstroma glucosiphilum]|uniref:Chromatin assembly factor 1 subunit A n=1 Tax=Pseudomicrostroma glucosiphilum TaxID=1684307 RepID=A0A316U916_9BASI|nr:hypothetical protein BCV69DRAFT_282071 [Pseudomicrostroma glucosiphilum]PWN21334.1 hypothetical protein BCV69DRAFT_282071 [Pseudomicrostroma glucosiphilum]